MRPTPDDDFEPVRLPRSGPRRIIVFVVGVALVIAILAGGVLVWSMRQIDPGGQGARVESVVIPSGSGVSQIGDVLEKDGVITSATVFGWYTRWRHLGTDWKAGTYVQFHRHMSMANAAKVLSHGPLPPQSTSLTIIPGTDLTEELTAINKAFPSISVNALILTLESGQVKSIYHPVGQTSWEGLLAADTFEFAKKSTPVKILQTLADRQTAILDSLGYDKAEALSGHSAWELITIASLVEREAGTPPDERGKVARVIDNRLDKNMALGIDAAVLYGLGRTSGSLTKSDLAKDTPYNTRIHTGLPPTPIATPAKSALQAAISPAAGPWLYYVLISNTPPTHFFTDSEKAFEKAKADAKARGVF
jgi:UPF0755 protein